MASSRLRAIILRLASLTLIGHVGRFIIGVILNPRPPTLSSPNTEEGLKVIACGFPRSGTMSLMLALNRLGFDCYHGLHFYTADSGYGVWTDHPKLWLEAATEANWNKWEQILRGYTAIVDFPAAFFYKQLMAAYPNAKVILNVRDPGQWHRSCMETLWWLHNRLFFQVFHSKAYLKTVDAAMWEGKFEGRFWEREFAIEVYKGHLEEVKRMVPKEKLLVYESKEGWAPLCNFLQVNLPETPFPYVNDASSWLNIMKQRETYYAVFSAVYVGLMSWALALLLKWGISMFHSPR